VSPGIASVVYAGGILCLFLLNRDKSVRTSKALWIPFVWLFIAGSRAPSLWFQAPNLVTDDQFIDGNPFERNIFSVLLFLAVLVLVSRRRKVQEVLKGNAPILLFIFYCLLSLLWSDYPAVGFKRWTKLLGDLGMVLIVSTDIDPSAAFDRLMTRTGFLIAPLSILLIRYIPDLGRRYDPWKGEVAWIGVGSSKNSLGLICMIIGLGTLWRTIHAFRCKNGKGRVRTLAAHGALLLMVIYLLRTANSATSTSCFFLGGALIVAISSFRLARKPLMVHVLTWGVVLLAASTAFFNVAGLVSALGRNPDLTGRTDMWAFVLNQPVNRVFGAGYESFWVGDRLTTIQRLSGQYVNQSHDGYIEILVNLGWVGVALLALVIVTAYAKITKAVCQDPEANCIRLAFFVVALIYNFTEAGFKMMDPVWIFFLWAILLVPIAPRVDASKANDVDPAENFSDSRRNASPVLIGR
jgi:exopolysaccharide production protein ExoQ